MVANESNTRGILSDADKRYLRDPEGYAGEHSRVAVSDRRKAIRERTSRAIQDFSILAEYMGEEAREEIFPVERHGEEWGEIYDGLVEMVAFIHLGLSSESDLEHLIADGVRRAEVRRGAVDWGLQVAVDCKLDIAHSPGMDMDAIAERLDAREYEKIPPGAGISFLQHLVTAGVLNPQKAVSEFEEVRDQLEQRSKERE